MPLKSFFHALENLGRNRFHRCTTNNKIKIVKIKNGSTRTGRRASSPGRNFLNMRTFICLIFISNDATAIPGKYVRY